MFSGDFANPEQLPGGYVAYTLYCLQAQGGTSLISLAAFYSSVPLDLAMAACISLIPTLNALY